MSLPDPAASRAVLIGVDTYHHLDDLPSVSNNVSTLTRLLTDDDLWGLPEEHCVPLINPRNPAEVLDTVLTAANEARDAFVVYFAGHGLLPPDANDALHLALPDSDALRLHYAVDYSRLRHLLVDVCRAQRKITILDCCFSARAMEGHQGAPLEFADQTVVDGTYVMTACGETKLALSPPDETYTAFTGELIKTLEEGIPHGPEFLDMDAIYRRVRRELTAKRRPVPQQRARNAGHNIALVRNRWSGSRSPEALEYGTALQDVFRRAEAQGIPPHRFMAAAGLPALVLNQYFGGRSVAPDDFLFDLTRFLAEQGLPLPPSDLDRLHDLRRRAQAADPDPAVQLLHWQEEFRRLKSDLAAAEREHDVEQRQSRHRLADLDKQLSGLGEQLANAVDRAETAELERDESRTTADRQQIRLEHASRYIHQVEEDLAVQQEEARRLRHEVAVLREQVQRLRDEPPAPGSWREAEGATTRVTAEATTSAHSSATHQETAKEAPVLSQDSSSLPPRAPASPDSAAPADGPSPVGRLRRIGAQAIAATAPLSALATTSGFVEGLQATPGPAVWKLLLYPVPALVGVAVVVILAIGSVEYVLGEDTSRRPSELSPVANRVFGIAIAGGFLGLPLGLLCAALDWAGLDLLGSWFADVVGLL